jgi:hypothetical protein
MKLEDFFPYILVETPGCPDPLVKQALVSAAIEFCKETMAWTESQDPVPLVDGVSDYELEAPSQAIALTVRDVWVGARRLNPITMRALQDVLPNWATAGSSDPVYYNSATERGSIRVFPIPTNTNGQELVMRSAFIPVAGASSLPDFLGQRHMELIAAGAKYRLMLIPGTGWSNPELGAYYKQMFAEGLIGARIDEDHDRVPGSVTVTARSFGF